MIAGVVLGPSLFTDLSHAQLALFPKETRSMLYAGSQLGVGLYMFMVGLTLEWVISGKRRAVRRLYQWQALPSLSRWPR
jgi:Kef-type K+ transport system membrane component KefB